MSRTEPHIQSMITITAEVLTVVAYGLLLWRCWRIDPWLTVLLAALAMLSHVRNSKEH